MVLVVVVAEHLKALYHFVVQNNLVLVQVVIELPVHFEELLVLVAAAAVVAYLIVYGLLKDQNASVVAAVAVELVVVMVETALVLSNYVQILADRQVVPFGAVEYDEPVELLVQRELVLVERVVFVQLVVELVVEVVPAVEQVAELIL